MPTENRMKDTIDSVAGYLASKNNDKYLWSYDHPRLRERVMRLIGLLRAAMYPGIFGGEHRREDIVAVTRKYLEDAARQLCDIIYDVSREKDKSDVEAITAEYISGLSGITDSLETDIQAAYEGDPAAASEAEIMLAYPAFEAISIYRLAHALYRMGIPFVPRMMTEYAHSKTGIDIHPGAEIGNYFFIDHGTGVVIGETCTIGEHVKLYQGVTLGAKSFELDENGNPVKGVKRHPDIRDHVIIYANATILGGRTVIGEHCIIGGSVWLTHSVEPGQTVFYNGGR